MCLSPRLPSAGTLCSWRLHRLWSFKIEHREHRWRLLPHAGVEIFLPASSEFAEFFLSCSFPCRTHQTESLTGLTWRAFARHHVFAGSCQGFRKMSRKPILWISSIHRWGELGVGAIVAGFISQRMAVITEFDWNCAFYASAFTNQLHPHQVFPE